MEPLAKRARVGYAPYDRDDEEAKDDELSLTPSQFAARQDPTYQLDKSRAKSAFKLKSRFESIFEKYERDFEGIGDEINLQTGEVVVDNGHLLSLQDVDDKEDNSADEAEEERILQGKMSRSKSLVQGAPNPYNAAHMLHSGWQQPPGLTPNFALSPRIFGAPHPLAFGSPIFGHGPVDPAWETPELRIPPLQSNLGLGNRGPGYAPPMHAYGSFFAPGSYSAGLKGFGSFGHQLRRVKSVKEVAPKSLPAPTSLHDEGDNYKDEDEDEDEILLGTSKEESMRDAAPQARKEVISSDLTPKILEQTEFVTSPTVGHNAKKPIRRPGRQRKTPEGTPKTTETVVPHQTDAPKIMVQNQGPAPQDSSNFVGRRSSRSRKQTEFYGQLDRFQVKQRRENAEMPMDISLSGTDTAMAEQQSIEKGPTSRTPPVDTSRPQEEDLGLRKLAVNAEGKASTASKVPSSSSANLTIPDSQDPGSSLSNRTVPDSQAPSSSLPKVPSSEDHEITAEATEQLVSVKVFVGNQLDPSHTFSDKKDIERVREPEIAKTSNTSELAKPSQREFNLRLADASGSANKADERDCVTVDVAEDLYPKLLDTPKPESQSQNEIDALPSDDVVQQAPDSTQTPRPEIPGPVGDSTNPPGSSKVISRTRVRSSTRSSRSQDESQGPISRLQLFPLPNAVVGDGPRRTASQAQPPQHPTTNSSSSSPLEAQCKSSKLAARSRSLPQTPQKPTNIHHLTTSAKKSALINLIPDNSDDEDELSILSSVHTPSSSSFRSSLTRGASHAPSLTPRWSSRKHNLLGARVRVSTPSSGNLQRLPNTDTKAFPSRRKHSNSGLANTSPLVRSALGNELNTPRKNTKAGSPMGSLVCTPGGTMGRCGQDGFVCDRDFCFTCCK